MSFISMVLILMVIGVLLGFINRYIPMAGSIRALLNLVVVLIVIYWILSLFGLSRSVDNLMNALGNFIHQTLMPVNSQIAKP